MSISNKEARESIYWLKLLEESQFIEMDYSVYIEKCNEINKILTSIVKTADENLKRK